MIHYLFTFVAVIIAINDAFTHSFTIFGIMVVVGSLVWLMFHVSLVFILLWIIIVIYTIFTSSDIVAIWSEKKEKMYQVND